MGRTTNSKINDVTQPIGTDAKGIKPPKGHKQKGAGTVITAKPPVVTADGITLRSHERLPAQLVYKMIITFFLE
jgi:hypothetical protein